MSSSRHRGSDLRPRSLQLIGRSSLPLQGVPAAKLELVKDIDRDEEEDLVKVSSESHHAMPLGN
jgi:hypothetical protein